MPRFLPPLPFWLTLRARQLSGLPLEWADQMRGGPLLPPRWLRHLVGGEDFVAVGERFLGHLRNLANLQPNESVLDVGCGAGRLALPLTRFLNTTGSYRGFDVVRPAVRWCRRWITPTFPQFRFDHADVRHPLYHPGGSSSATDYRFPYPDATFDLVIIASIFTHLRPEEVRQYLTEVRRVLRSGGRCLATFFLLDEEGRSRMGQPESRFNFCHDAGGCWTANPAKPEAAIAYDAEEVGRLFAEVGLELRGPVWFGSWSGREGRDGQDLVLLGRPGEPC